MILKIFRHTKQIFRLWSSTNKKHVISSSPLLHDKLQSNNESIVCLLRSLPSPAHSTCLQLKSWSFLIPNQYISLINFNRNKEKPFKWSFLSSNPLSYVYMCVNELYGKCIQRILHSDIWCLTFTTYQIYIILIPSSSTPYSLRPEM